LGWSRRLTAEVALGALAIACGGQTVDSPHGAPAPDEGPGDDCPTTLAETNGAACGQAGLMCTQGFDCDGEMQDTNCTCKSAHFECEDPIGLLPPGHAPRCLSNDTAPFYCPASMFLAEGLTCNVVGESCYYEGSTCADGLTKLNYCECEPDGHGGYTLECRIVACNDLGDGDAAAGDADAGDAGDGGGIEDSP
jgi:hypothetical protein